jgi:hypothetical protein
MRARRSPGHAAGCRGTPFIARSMSGREGRGGALARYAVVPRADGTALPAGVGGMGGGVPGWEMAGGRRNRPPTTSRGGRRRRGEVVVVAVAARRIGEQRDGRPPSPLQSSRRVSPITDGESCVRDRTAARCQCITTYRTLVVRVRGRRQRFFRRCHEGKTVLGGRP